MLGKIKINHKLSTRTLLYIFLLFPFIQQRTMQEFSAVMGALYRYGALLSSLIMIKIVFKNSFHLKLFKNAIPYIVFWAIYFFNTVIQQPALTASTGYYCLIFFSFTIFLCFTINSHPRNLIEALVIIYITEILLNWIILILFPEGLFKVTVSSAHSGHLLGDDNALIYVILPGVIITLLYVYIREKHLSLLALLIVAIAEFTFVQVWSATSVVTFTLFIILLIVEMQIKSISPCYLLAGVIFTIFIVLFLTNVPFIQHFIVNRLHKDITFSNRTILWTQAFSMIARKPIFGYGGYFRTGQFWISNRWLYPAHTTYLQILLDGGIVLFAFFILTILISFRNLSKYKDHTVSKVLAIGITCMLINFIFEQSPYHHITILFMLAINCDELIPALDRYALSRK